MHGKQGTEYDAHNPGTPFLPEPTAGGHANASGPIDTRLLGYHAHTQGKLLFSTPSGNDLSNGGRHSGMWNGLLQKLSLAPCRVFDGFCVAGTTSSA